MVLSKPGMFRIQSVEDIYILLFAETFFNDNDDVIEWITQLNDFIVREVDPNMRGFDWCKIIRLYSGSDSHSLELFTNLYKRFIMQ